MKPNFCVADEVIPVLFLAFMVTIDRCCQQSHATIFPVESTGSTPVGLISFPILPEVTHNVLSLRRLQKFVKNFPGFAEKGKRVMERPANRVFITIFRKCGKDKAGAEAENTQFVRCGCARMDPVAVTNPAILLAFYGDRSGLNIFLPNDGNFFSIDGGDFV